MGTEPRPFSFARILAGLSVPAVLLVAAACGGSTSSRTPIPATTPSDAAREALEQIEAQVAEVRELEPLADVDLRLVTREAAETYFREEAEAEAVEDVAVAQPVYQLLGLISPEDDLLDLQLSLVSSQVMGFYETDEEAMFLVDQQGELDTLGVITFSHEFVHALQDQHFDLDALMEEGEGDWDTTLAVLALIEGDATLAGVAYASSFISLADLLEIDFDEVSRQMSELESFPEALQQELNFPYEEGATLAGMLLDDGGWAAVDDAFDAPPTTTEQVLHPDKYLAGEARRDISLPDLGSDLGGDWQLQAGNTLGEFLLTNHLDTELSRSEAMEAAAGWGGDRWDLYADGADEQLLLLVVEWDTSEELEEFFAAYLDLLDARSEGDWEPLGDDAALWEGAGESIYASKNGDRATIIISTDGEALEQARHALDLP